MLEENVSLWSDDRIELERGDAYLRWCFETGDPQDLKRFEELDQELSRRRFEEEALRSLVRDIKEDPIWREEHERMFNVCKSAYRGS